MKIFAAGLDAAFDGAKMSSFWPLTAQVDDRVFIQPQWPLLVLLVVRFVTMLTAAVDYFRQRKQAACSSSSRSRLRCCGLALSSFLDFIIGGAAVGGALYASGSDSGSPGLCGIFLAFSVLYILSGLSACFGRAACLGTEWKGRYELEASVVTIGCCAMLFQSSAVQLMGDVTGLYGGAFCACLFAGLIVLQLPLKLCLAGNALPDVAEPAVPTNYRLEPTVFTFLLRQLNPLFSVGLARQLELEDLPAMPRNLDTRRWAADGEQMLVTAESQAHARVTQEERLTIIKACWQAFGKPWVLLGLLQCVTIALPFAGPLLLNRTLAFLEGSDETNPWQGVLWASLIVFSSLATAWFSFRFNLLGLHIQTELRAVLMAAIFRRMLSAPPAARAKFDSGLVTNFVSADISRLQNAVTSVHQLWALPVQVAVTLYLLYTQVQGAFLAGLAVILLFVPINLVISKRIGSLTAAMMTHRDERVKRSEELLKSIRTVKLLALETPLLQRVHIARALEVKALATRKYLDAACVYLWASTPVLVSLATFATVVLSAPASSTSALSASAVFTTVSLLQLLIFPLNAYSWVFTGVLEAIVSKKRIEGFLFGSDGDDNERNNLLSAPPASSASASTSAPPSPALTLAGRYTFFPSSSAGEEGRGAEESKDRGKAKQNDSVAVPLLSSSPLADEAPTFALDLSFEGRPVSLPKGALVTITGPVAVGKTATLQTALGLMKVEAAAPSTAISTNTTTFSYASQSPWVFEGSLKENVTLAYSALPSTAVDEERYRAAIKACCLEVDLAMMRQGDSTVLSSKNTTLSGGQLARVNLARALYCPGTKVLLADDACASLDQAVSLAVWRQAFLSFKTPEGKASPLHRGRELIVAVTHDPRFVASSDLAVILENGRVAFFGPPSAAPARLLPAALASASSTEAPATSGSSVLSTSNVDATVTAVDSAYPKATDDRADVGTDVHEESVERREYGVIKARILVDYRRAVGAPLTVTVLVSLTLMQLSRNGSDWWLSLWSAADNDDPSKAAGINGPIIRRLSALNWTDRQFLLVFGIIASVNTLSTLLRSWSFAKAGLNACVKVHDRLLSALCFAPMAFHDAVPVGRLTNRLSADQFSTDESLPFMLNIFFAQGWGLIGTILVLCLSTSGLFLLAVPFLAALYYRLQRKYRATSRELRRLDSTSRSPLFAHFSDSFAGTQVLWAQSIGRDGAAERRGKGAIDTACAHVTALLDVNQTTSYVSGVASQWLGLRLAGIGALVIAIVAFFAVGARIYLDDRAAQSVAPSKAPPPSPDFSALAGITGFALSYCIPVVAALEGLIGSLSETEKELVAVERAIEYTDLKPEGERQSQVASAEAAERECNQLLSLNPSFPTPSASASAIVAVDRPLTSTTDWQGLLSAPLFVHFDDITLRYPGQERPALRDFTLRIPAGATVVCGGRTGAGKSSLLAVLMGLVRPSSGRVLIGNAETGQPVDAATIPLPMLRGRIAAMIPQQPLLIEGTVRENLDPWNKAADDAAELNAALQSCGLTGGLATFPPSSSAIALDDKVEAGGANFSVGERQLMALARTLVTASRMKPSILLVDEAASAADEATDRLVESILASHPALKSCTKLIVAHRARTLTAAPLVAMLREGELAEFGPPAELLSSGNGELSRVIRASRELR